MWYEYNDMVLNLDECYRIKAVGNQFISFSFPQGQIYELVYENMTQRDVEFEYIVDTLLKKPTTESSEYRDYV